MTLSCQSSSCGQLLAVSRESSTRGLEVLQRMSALVAPPCSTSSTFHSVSPVRLDRRNISDRTDMGQNDQTAHWPGRDPESQVPACPACGRFRPRRETLVSPRHYRCPSCRSLVCWSWPDEIGLARLYAVAWSQEDGGRFATGATNSNLAKQLVALSDKSVSGLSCLDFGAGRGDLSRELQAQGAVCTAVEPFGPDPQIDGVRWVASLDQTGLYAPFDVAYAIEVIEHHTDPNRCLTELSKVMGPGSLLVITTPNARGLNALLTRRRWREALNTTHLCLFSFKGLRVCAERAGFKLVCRPASPIHFGSRGLRRFLQTALQRARLDGSLRMVFELDRSESPAGTTTEK